MREKFPFLNVFAYGLWLCALASLLQAQAPPYADAQIRTGPAPGVRLSSGLMVCDEELFAGRWVNRYWTSTGQIKPEVHLAGQSQRRSGLPQDSFRLSIEGQDLGGSWRWVKSEKNELPNGGLLVMVELTSTVRPISIRLKTALHGGPVMVRWIEVTNKGSKPTAITDVSPWSGIVWDVEGYKERLQADNDSPFEVATTKYESWGEEGEWEFTPLTNGTKTAVGDRGRSGWGHPTFFARNRATGEWFVSSLAWSGNWAMHVSAVSDDAKDNAHLSFDLGPDAADPVLRVIDPGETVRTPETHVLLMHSDLDHVIQALHKHVREDVLPPARHKDSYVEANHRGYIVDHESEEGLKREVDIAASVGAEEFIVDAGWNGPEPNSWANNAGDWYAGAWLPHDLTPVREYARQKGMKFGLWVEIESVGAASKLKREHPDWVLTRNGEPIAGGRNLDFANPAVAAWAEEQIAQIITKYGLDMFRIDYNTFIFAGGNRIKDGFLENTEWRHVEALYKIFDHLRKRFPNVVFQNCAAGGGRLDYGIMQRFDNTELSDWLRAPRALKILNGVTWVLPPEILLCTFGTESAGLESDGNLDLQLQHVMMALPIFRGITPSIDELDPLLKERIRDYVQMYKDQLRATMAGARVYHHTPVLPLKEASPWVVLEYATEDGAKDMIGVFRTQEASEPVYQVLPRGLNPSRTYSVHLANANLTERLSGAELMNQGMRVRLDDNLSSELLLFTAQ